MNTNFKNILIVICFVLSACTDVIDVEVPTATPRLVIEASLDWEKGTQGNNQVIKLSTSTPYFSSNSRAIVTGASVKVTHDNSNAEYIFINQNDGNYTISTFVPELNQSYTLEVIYNGETYVAHETLMPVTDMSEVYQTIEDGFKNDALEVNVDFVDPANQDNFYLFKFQEHGDLLPVLFDMSDEFTDGNEMTIYYEKEEDEDINQEEFVPGDVVDIELFGISEPYFDYVRLLIEQSESGGDPFSSTPVVLRGNCINATNADNYAFGYFRMTQVVKTSYTFE